jgi:metallo-beta-lactamase family protein
MTNMNVTFYGAVREVTGSMHLLTTDVDHILMDCGMFQGRRKETGEKNRVVPFDPGILSNIVLSHAHIDHSGRIPLLSNRGFSGRIVCTRPTAAACKYLLLDSAHIQESDANYLNYKSVRNALSKMKTSGHGKKISKSEKSQISKLLKKGRHDLNTEVINDLIEDYHLERVEPLYTAADAEAALTYFDDYPYNYPISIGQEMSCTFYDAGHILGSAITVIRVCENGRHYNIGFTGDIGRFEKPIIKDPTLNFAVEHKDIDLLIMESTYGDRLHDPVKDLKPRLKEVLQDTYNRKGTLLIPSFAFGRTQEILYILHELYDTNEVPRFPIYVDSPLATKLTKVFAEHPEVYDEETHDTFLERGKNPFSHDQIHFVGSVEESIALNKDENPHIVVSASGMCEAGRILHHLRYKIHNARNTILMVGYQAQHTLGRRILEQGLAYERSGRKGAPPMVKFFNKQYPLKARVVAIDGFSAHADKNEMLRFLKESNLNLKKIAVVHGEEDQSLVFGQTLKSAGYSVVVPRMGQTIQI